MTISIFLIISATGKHETSKEIFYFTLPFFKTVSKKIVVSPEKIKIFLKMSSIK